MDVYDDEPLPPDHPLRSLPNVVLTPHVGELARLKAVVTRVASAAATVPGKATA